MPELVKRDPAGGATRTAACGSWFSDAPRRASAGCPPVASITCARCWRGQHVEVSVRAQFYRTVHGLSERRTLDDQPRNIGWSKDPAGLGEISGGAKEGRGGAVVHAQLTLTVTPALRSPPTLRQQLSAHRSVRRVAHWAELQARGSSRRSSALLLADPLKERFTSSFPA